MRQCGCVIYTLQTARDVWGGAAGASHELLHSSGTLDGGEGEGGGRGEGVAGGRGEGGEERGLRGRRLTSQTRADEVRELSVAVGEGAGEKEMGRRGRVEGGGGGGGGGGKEGRGKDDEWVPPVGGGVEQEAQERRARVGRERVEQEEDSFALQRELLKVGCRNLYVSYRKRALRLLC